MPQISSINIETCGGIGVYKIAEEPNIFHVSEQIEIAEIEPNDVLIPNVEIRMIVNCGTAVCDSWPLWRSALHKQHCSEFSSFVGDE